MEKKLIIFREGGVGGGTPFAENSAKIINLIFEPFPNSQILLPIIDSLIQNAYDITCQYQLFPSGREMNMFHCDKCQYKAISKNLLKTHHKYIHTDSKFTFDICGHQESSK